MYRSFLISAAAIALMAGTISAQACDINAADLQPGNARIKLPHFAPPKEGRDYDSIVGVWQVAYSVSDTVVLNTIDTWSSDGNEFLSADKNPILGNVCAGVWRSNGRTAQLHHLGWTFDSSGNPTGTLVDDESVKLNHKGSGYSGTFDFKFYDTTGTLVKEVTGTDSAARVTAP